MNFARRDPVGARTGGCEQGFKWKTQVSSRLYITSGSMKALDIAQISTVSLIGSHMKNHISHVLANSPKFLSALTGPLGMTPMSKSNQSRFCVWLTTEPSPKLPDTLLQSMRVVAWDNITDHLLNAEDTTSSSSGSGQPVTSHSLLDNVLKSGKLKRRSVFQISLLYVHCGVLWDKPTDQLLNAENTTRNSGSGKMFLNLVS